MRADPDCPTRRAAPRRRRIGRSSGRVGGRAGALALALSVAVAGTAAGCGSDEVSPTEARRQRVQARLEATFSKAQADCILGALDTATIAALARSTDLPAGSLQLSRYSDAVTVCVAAGGNATVRTTPSTGEATTTAPTTTAKPAG
jgi:hypothetical protein